MLKNLVHPNLVNFIVHKRIRKFIRIMNHIHAWKF